MKIIPERAPPNCITLNKPDHRGHAKSTLFHSAFNHSFPPSNIICISNHNALFVRSSVVTNGSKEHKIVRCFKIVILYKTDAETRVLGIRWLLLSYF